MLNVRSNLLMNTITFVHEKYCTIKLEEMYKLFILSMSEI